MQQQKMTELSRLGQSVWLDYISKPLIEKGKLSELISQGLRGMTSNPSIFDKAISASSDYDEKIKELHKSGKTSFEIYDDLTVKDIQDAADMFKHVYEKTKFLDGYVSLEVNPKMAFDAEKTVTEGIRLHKKVNRPNLMLKVPATEAGFKAVEELTALGLNVNATLIFSLKQYESTARAYLKGITRLIENKGNAKDVRSVASVFVSRVDAAIDKDLKEFIKSEERKQIMKELVVLQGKAAVANSKMIYSKFMDIFTSLEARELKGKGANLQRVLWGSTSTKNPEYSDTKYVTELIGKDTVNTIPHKTLDAFLDHGEAKIALTGGIDEACRVVNTLKGLEIDIDKVCAKLLEDGLDAFVKSFDSLLKSIEEKAENLCKV